LSAGEEEQGLAVQQYCRQLLVAPSECPAPIFRFPGAKKEARTCKRFAASFFPASQSERHSQQEVSLFFPAHFERLS
jgi:hypothetical protein